MKPATILLTLVLAIFIVGELGTRPSSGQQQETNRKPACGCYVCGLLLAVNFPNKAPDCVGILATDACPEEIAKMPAETRKAFCKEIKARSKDQSLDGCLILRHGCETGEDPLPDKCEPPRSPWLGPSSDCKDVQTWQIEQRGPAVSVSMCGQIIFTNPRVGTDPMFSDAYKGALKLNLQQTIGDKVCCDKFREAARTGMPCDPRKDVDCDGKPNSSDDDRRYEDSDTYFPTIEIITRTDGAPIATFPTGLSLDEIYPDVETCKDCQWKLMKGELKCNVNTPEGKQHVYQAKWKCPSTGIEVDTFKYAPATAPCK
jgi:hypothetical protein